MKLKKEVKKEVLKIADQLNDLSGEIKELVDEIENSEYLFQSPKRAAVRRHSIDSTHNLVNLRKLIYNFNSFNDGTEDEEVDDKVCKNLTENNPVDEFICSKCGFEIDEFSRREDDPEYGDKAYYEFEFKFCPRCGARVLVEKA